MPARPSPGSAPARVSTNSGAKAGRSVGGSGASGRVVSAHRLGGAAQDRRVRIVGRIDDVEPEALARQIVERER